MAWLGLADEGQPPKLLVGVSAARGNGDGGCRVLREKWLPFRALVMIAIPPAVKRWKRSLNEPLNRSPNRSRGAEAKQNDATNSLPFFLSLPLDALFGIYEK